VREICNDTINQKSITGLTLGAVALTAVFYFVSTRKRVDYDDIKQVLYIVDTKKQTEIEVPVEKVDKILYSAIGGRGNNSYVIVYRDIYNQRQKVRLFSIPFDNSVDTIITDAKLKNPDLVTRNWSIGWNELSD
jgi:anionic cell wall polymer biosynthesis LytR-Cps2A-Psr (LCP) family protein